LRRISLAVQNADIVMLAQRVSLRLFSWRVVHTLNNDNQEVAPMSHGNRRRRPLVVALAAIAFPGFPEVSSAQEHLLEEVIVTARRREESMQETPVAVTALSATALRDAGVRNLRDLNSVAPNIDVHEANGTAPLANIYIRGVGQRNTEVNIDSGVGIYIDDVYIGRPDGALLDLNDIQSVQVLRGPQGTLFGKNTTGGALVFTTNRPVEKLEGVLEARVGNYDRLDVSGVLNVPLGDSLWSRWSVSSVNRDGYVDNEFLNEEYLDEERLNAIGQFRWLATDNLTIDLNLNYTDTDQTTRPQKCRLVPDVVGWQAALFDLVGVEPSTGRTLDDFCQDNIDAGDGLEVLSDLDGQYEAETMGASITAEWEVNDNLSLKSVTAYRNTEAGQDDELDHTTLPWLHRTQFTHPFGNKRDTDQYSQEFQLTGSAVDDRLQYVAGLFYFKEETDGQQQTAFLGPFDPGFGGFFVLNTSGEIREVDNEAWAAFAQLEWSWTDSWRSTLGVRYTDEERELEVQDFVPVASTLDANGGAVTELFTGVYSVDRSVFEYNPEFDFAFAATRSGDTSADDTTFMASLQYLLGSGDWIDQGSVYLTYSEGFLSGGLSEAPGGFIETFEPEEVDNWELGIKMDLLDRRLRINAAVFNADYTNRQLTTVVIDPEILSPAPATLNAKESTITGIELEATWLPVDNLQLQFNATFNDGDIDEFDDVLLTVAEAGEPVPEGCEQFDLVLLQVDSCPSDRSGENLPRLAEATYFLSAQYLFNTSVGMIIPRVQASLKEDVEYCFDASSCNSGLWLEDEQFQLSARVTWVSTDGNWTGAIYGTNLTDEEYIVGGTAIVDSAGVGGWNSAAPLMYGAELKYSF
jgi:iron complex outermembrane receptor protein